jgi:hypothetical protein
MRHKSELDRKTRSGRKETWVDIWGIDAEEVARILQADKYSSHKQAILDAFVKSQILPRIPDTYCKYEYADWVFSDHSEADIHDYIDHSKHETKKIHNTVLKGNRQLHSAPGKR